jgi:hypothetical protein
VEKKYAGREKISVISHAAISARNIFYNIVVIEVSDVRETKKM